MATSDEEFAIALDLRCALWVLFIRVPLSFFIHYYSTSDPIFTTNVNVSIFFFPLLFLLSLLLSFVSFNLSIRVRPHKLHIMPANFSPLISVLSFSSFCFERSYLAILLLLVTFTSTYYVPLLEWIHRLLIRSIFMNNADFNIVWSTTGEAPTDIKLLEVERPSGDQISVDIEEEEEETAG